MGITDKEYLGDSVYVEYDGYVVTLTTENGYGDPSNIIYLGPEELKAMKKYLKKLEEAR